jgi:hypothetical protein
VNRPENIPGLVFEEVTAKLVGQTADGPSGPITGVFVGEELHDDGTFSDKLFAPGYGEFLSAHEGDLEAMAVAAPVDAIGGGVPAELTAIDQGADRIFGSGLRTDGQWKQAADDVTTMALAWDAFAAGDVPPRLVRPTTRALSKLAARLSARDRLGTRGAAVDVASAGLDLQLRYRPVAEIDIARFGQWARRTIVHAKMGSLGSVRSDLATMEWIRDRFVPAVDVVDLTSIDAHLGSLRDGLIDRDLAAVTRTARSLRRLVEHLS